MPVKCKMHRRACHSFRMSTNERLVRARELAGYESARAAATAMGANYNTYAQHENGTRDVSRSAAIRYSRFYRVSLEWLLTGRGQPATKGNQTPVVGLVGAGAEVLPFDDYPQGGGMEFVDAPAGNEDCVAVAITGDSQYPLQEGWLIFYRKTQEGVPEECLGKLCVVKTSNGTTLLKTLRRGSRKNIYSLESWNAPTMEDVKLEWASRVLDIRPK